MTAEEIAAILVANGYGHRLPLSQTRCVDTVELKAVPDWGRIYVKRDGEIRVGYTLRESQRVGRQTRSMMLGEA